MEFNTVMAYSARLFHQYAASSALGTQHPFARALQENPDFYDDVKKEFFDRIAEVCVAKGHYGQKCALRKTLVTHIRNMVLWEEYFQKRSAEAERQLIYVYFKESWGNVPFTEFEKQTAYFQLYSTALYTLFRAVLERYYDQVIEKSYARLLVKSYRSYYQRLFESILYQIRGEPYLEMEIVLRLKDSITAIERLTFSGDEKAYDLSNT
jgi:hypothetical protein